MSAPPSRFVARLSQGEAQTVVTYGTSLTAAGAWVGHLAAALRTHCPGIATFVNSGQSAMWSKWGVLNLETRVLAHRPHAVFLEFAINDAFVEYETSVAEARDNLLNMIERIEAARADAEVILMTMNHPIGVHLQARPDINDYYQMYRQVAQERGLRLIDHHLAWNRLLIGDPARFLQYVPDGIHPSAEGYRHVVTPAILTALGVPAA